MKTILAIEHPNRPAAVGAQAVLQHLQQIIQAWMDGDHILAADGTSLLATLDRAFEGLAGENPAAAQAGIANFVDRVQALIAAGALAAGDGQPQIEAATVLAAGLRSAGGMDG